MILTVPDADAVENAIGAATRAYTTERRWLAGALLALLWIKPNLAIAVPVVLVWSRSWRMLTGFSVATTTLFASSLAFGVGQACQGDKEDSTFAFRGLLQ